MAYWLIKSDPKTRSFSDLADEGWQGAEWNGVREDACFDLFAAMREKDLAFFYHTGEENCFFGILRILGAAHPDTTDDSGQWLSVDVAVFLKLINEVQIANIQDDPELGDFAKTVEQGPCIQKVSFEQWTAICERAGMPRIPESG